MNILQRCGTLMGLFTVSFCAAGSSPAAEIDFQRDVRPILSDHCFQCHGPDEAQRVSEFRLDIQSSPIMDLGDGPAIVPKDAAASQLYQRITSDDPDYRMPPPESDRRLNARQVAAIGEWINEGANWQQHWSFVAPTRQTVPEVSSPGWCHNLIDRFVLAKLDQHGLQPSPPAQRSKLLRRITLDLTGLPPTPAEITAFETDRSSAAWLRVVDRLLQSPRYGERMAIDWLDAARYADTSGYQNDGPRSMWRWRDWVIDALNDNMPFDQFTIQQLAGDLLPGDRLPGDQLPGDQLPGDQLPGATLEQRIATGFNRNHRGNAEGGIIPEEYQVEYVADRVDTTATVWLGLTMGCARCHDHKYDNITQQDFYRVFAYFNNIPEFGRAIKEGNSPPYIQAPTEQQQRILAELDLVATVARERVQQLSADLPQQQADWEASYRGELPDQWTVTDGMLAQVLDEETHFAGAALEIGDVADFGYFDKFSICAKVKPAKSTGTIVSRMVPVEQGAGYCVHLQDGHLQINFVKRWLDDSIRVQSSRPLTLDQWQHLAVTYDGSRVASGIRAFVDGRPLKLDVVHDFINQSFASDQPVRLGGGHASFFGEIDDVQIYQRVLTGEEVSAIAVSDSIAAIVKTDPADRTPGQSWKLARYFIQNHASREVRAAHEHAVQAQRARDEFDESIPTVMVMQEKKTAPQAFILHRGQYDARGERVSPGVPAVLPPLPKDAANNRLGFARWLVSPNHPLTARVTVNRVWQMYFGTGLVKTTEDFGSQGDLPSHPGLLDALALEFVRSGWDLKALHRMIVTSATYQQDSTIDGKGQRLDPENRLLARGPRFRLPAETVRDQVLLISGLLSSKLGGASVRPYQPEGLWKEIASTTDYKQSHGEDLYRRSLYTYWKRTVAPPTMVTLDATSRESCVVKRSKTNTPLQALALMNDVAFVEASRAAAQRLLNSDLTAPQRIARIFRQSTGRQPTDAEAEVLSNSWQTYHEAFVGNSHAARQLISIGESSVEEYTDVEQLAAWTMLVSLVLNLDEVITKD